MGLCVLSGVSHRQDPPNRPVPVLWGSHDGGAADPAGAGQAVRLRRAPVSRRQGHPPEGLRGVTARLPRGTHTMRVRAWIGQIPPVPFVVLIEPQGRQRPPRWCFKVWRVDLPPRRPNSRPALALFRAWKVPLPLCEADQHALAGLERFTMVRGAPRPQGVLGRAT